MELQLSPFQFVPNSPFIQVRNNSFLAPVVPEICDTQKKSIYQSPLTAAVVPSTPHSQPWHTKLTVTEELVSRKETWFHTSGLSRAKTTISSDLPDQEVPCTPHQDKGRTGPISVNPLSIKKRKNRAKIKQQRVLELAFKPTERLKSMEPLFDEGGNIFG